MTGLRKLSSKCGSLIVTFFNARRGIITVHVDDAIDKKERVAMWQQLEDVSGFHPCEPTPNARSSPEASRTRESHPCTTPQGRPWVLVTRQCFKPCPNGPGGLCGHRPSSWPTPIHRLNALLKLPWRGHPRVIKLLNAVLEVRSKRAMARVCVDSLE